MHYVIQRAGKYYYNRRVPSFLKDFVPLRNIRISLNTDSRKAAYRLAMRQNEKFESYWITIAQTGDKHSEQHYKALVERAGLLGFSYQPSNILATLPFQEIIPRLLHVEKQGYDPHHTDAVLGNSPAPSVPVLRLNKVLDHFWEYSKDKTLNKSPNQIRKWRNPRIKAFRNLIDCVGNKPIHELTRDDMLCFRKWWVERVISDELVCATANKDIIHIKTIICLVADNAKIKLDDSIFKKLILSEDDSKRRLPFPTEYLKNTLFKAENLAGLNEQARHALYAFAETGAGISELTGLLPEDIILDHDIPHICIVPRRKKLLKTKFRARKIPLVGYALDTFKACPNGFTDYSDRPDSLSAVLSKYLHENELMPSEQHTVYSLRHSFQDRLLKAKALDRVQADLMGHKFIRPDYGDGATLEDKLECMEKIQLK